MLIRNKNNTISFSLLLISTLSVFLLFAWQGHKELSFWDEGFFWYGVERVLLGEVPIRDFMAYDPGRYYWSAALMKVLGHEGIIGLRISLAILQAAGLFIALLLISKDRVKTNKRDLVFWILATPIFLVWMIPYYKMFDICSSIFLVWVIASIMDNPSSKRFFFSGLALGTISTFGRNHGVYGLLGSCFALGFLMKNQTLQKGMLFKNIRFWFLGLILGFLPVIMMAIVVPGFGDSFWKSIIFLFEQKATNLPLAVPWPWQADLKLPFRALVRQIFFGSFFIAPLFFSTITILWVLFTSPEKRNTSPVLLASSILTLPYMHYAFSRADVDHLALAIFPFLLGVLAFLATARPLFKWSMASFLFIASTWVMIVRHPGWSCLKTGPCTKVRVKGGELLVNLNTEKDISFFRKLKNSLAPNGQSFVIIPFLPGVYALLEAKSPQWEIYALWPRSRHFEEIEIKRIKNYKPSFALVVDLPLDGREDLRFKMTHPLTNRFIEDNFELQSDSPEPSYKIYRAKDTG